MTAPVAVVTGGGKGIGRTVTERLAGQGYRVIAVGRDGDALARVAAAEGVTSAVCDVTDEDQVAAMFADLDAVDVLVNNAGVSSSAPIESTSLADWRLQLDVNATGAFLCTRAALPLMRPRAAGRIVTVASTAGVTGAAYITAYTASKHAAVGLMRAVAAEVAGTSITANAVCPGYVRTEMTDRSVARIAEKTGRSRDQATEAIVSSSPLGRLIEPGEVAAAVDYLCSAEAAAVNGQVIVIDGGALRS